MKLYEFIGFREHPFLGKSAEAEKDYLSEIFVKPKYYNTLLDGLENGSSRFIIGHRGHGKTAILLELEKELQKRNIFTVRVDEYDSIPVKDNEKEMIKLFIESIAKKLSVDIFTNKNKLSTLSSEEKEILDFIYKYYFKALTQSEFENLRNNIIPFKRRNAFKRFFNFIIHFFNSSGTAISHLTAGMIRDTIQNPNLQLENIIYQKKYLVEFEENRPSQDDIKKTDKWNYQDQKNILNKFAQIIKKLGFKQIVIFIDKIDEYSKVASNVNSVKDFVKDILNDTNIFINDNIVFSFTIWTQVKLILEAEGIRFDKVDIDDIRWKDDKMLEILNKRLNYFSLKKNILFEDIVKNKSQRDHIIRLANGSPRDLILLLKRIYDEQNELSQSHQNSFSENSINKGIDAFIENYNFSAHSSVIKKNEKLNVTQDLNRVLKIRKTIFDLNDMIQKCGLKNSNLASKACDKLILLQVIKEEDELKLGGHRQFKIIDPKIEHLIKTGKTKLN